MIELKKLEEMANEYKDLITLDAVLKLEAAGYKLFSRVVRVRKPINKFGKLGYPQVLELVYTNDITSFNFRKQIKFEPVEKSWIKPTSRHVVESLRYANKVIGFDI